MQSKEVQRYLKLNCEAEKLLKMAITNLELSSRAYDRILKVARTIADFFFSDSIGTHPANYDAMLRRSPSDLRQKSVVEAARQCNIEVG